MEENKLPSEYEILPPHLLGDELLYMSSEKSLKATSLGDLLPKELIKQENNIYDKKDFPSKCYHGNTSSELCPSTSQESGLIEKAPPANDLPPPSPLYTA